MMKQNSAKYCYAEADKYWAIDSVGVRREMFHAMGGITVYGEDLAQNYEKEPGCNWIT